MWSLCGFFDVFFGVGGVFGLRVGFVGLGVGWLGFMVGFDLGGLVDWFLSWVLCCGFGFGAGLSFFGVWWGFVVLGGACVGVFLVGLGLWVFFLSLGLFVVCWELCVGIGL